MLTTKDYPKIVDLIALARRLPIDGDVKNFVRINHAFQYGHIVVVESLMHKVVGYAEAYRMQAPPQYPVVPWPKDDPTGKYVYCWAAVCDRGYLGKLIDTGKRLFSDCSFIAWHHHKKNNKLYIERI